MSKKKLENTPAERDDRIKLDEWAVSGSEMSATTSANASAQYLYDRIMYKEGQPMPYIMKTPLSRRRSLGDQVTVVDQPGFWVRVDADPAGVPCRATLICVDDTVTTYTIIGEQDTDARLIERLPKGIYFYLW